MELKEQPELLTLGNRLGDVPHFSPLLWKIERMSGCPLTAISTWLLKSAVARGASHYRRDFPAGLPPDNASLTNEELGAALCLMHHPYDPVLIRAAAQLLSAPDTQADFLIRLALLERCEPVLLHIAEAAAYIVPLLEPWRTLRNSLPGRHRVRGEALPHWSRFVSQTGYTPAGRGQHIEWLMRDE